MTDRSASVIRPFVILMIFSLTWAMLPRAFEKASAQTRLSDDDSFQINRNLEDAVTGTVDQGIRSLDDSAAILAPYAKRDSGLNAVKDLFGLERDRRTVYGSEFRNLFNESRNGDSPEARRSALLKAKMELIRPASDLMQMAASDGISADEAQKMLSLAKSVAQAVDDLADERDFGEKGSFEGAKSALQKFLTIASGIAGLKKGIADGEANQLMAAFRDTIGQIALKLKELGLETTNPLAAFEYPAALTAAQVQVVKEGFDRVTDAVELMGDVINNDTPEARQRLLRAVERVEETLSPQNFARSLITAAIDRTADRLPFVRTFRNLLGPSGPDFCELKKVSEYPKQGRFEPTATVNCRVYDPLGNELVGTTYDKVTLVSPDPLTRNKRNLTHTYNGCGEIWAGTWNFSFTLEQRFGFYPAISCGDLKLDPYYNYELIVAGDKYGRLVLARAAGPGDDINIPFDLIDSSGNIVAVIITDGYKQETYFNVAPGTYRVRYRAEESRYNNDRLNKEIQDTDFENVKISAGKVTRLTLPVVKWSG